jgi:ATP-dependent protease HslVU (ClpYQ) ATPase subunit
MATKIDRHGNADMNGSLEHEVPGRGKERVVVAVGLVHEKLGDLVDDEDLSQFIL